MKTDRRLWAALGGLVAAAVAASIVASLSGCTPGQVAPSAIKNCTFAAAVDARVTAQEIRSLSATQPADVATQRDKALNCLDRIGGTAAGKYEDGFLSSVVHWFQGTKPTGGGQ